MTAAMAFFSITLTLNLMGVRLADLKASDLKPSSLRRTFYEANAHMVRNVDNLRVVYEVEARVRDLRRAADADDSSSGTGDSSPSPSGSQPDQTKQQKPVDQAPDGPAKNGAGKSGGASKTAPDGGGTSRRENGGDHSGRRVAVGAAKPPAPATLDNHSTLVNFGVDFQQRKQGTKMEQFVPQGAISESGISERRMA